MGNLSRVVADLEPLARRAGYNPDTLAALCRVSLRQLERVLRKTRGKTPTQFCRELQCDDAKPHLASGLQTRAVAEKLKFASPQYFCRVFKKIQGGSPQEFASG